MGWGERIKNTFLDCDQFASPYLLRFNNNENYPTLTGSAVSVLHYLTFFILFGFMMQHTLNRETIISTTHTDYSSNPQMQRVVFSPTHKTMFAVGVP